MRAEIFAVYSRLIDFPGLELAAAARNGAIGYRLRRLQARVGAPDPPPMRTELDGTALEQVYISTFDIGAPEPPVPLYETAYPAARHRRMQVLEDIVRFYEFFDLKLRRTPREMPDHLTVELEFMAALAQMEHAAELQGARAEPFRLAQRDFLERHLLPMLACINAGPITEPFYRDVVNGVLAFATWHFEQIPQQSNTRAGAQHTIVGT